MKVEGEKIPKGKDVGASKEILCKAIPDRKAEKEAIQSGMEE